MNSGTVRSGLMNRSRLHLTTACALLLSVLPAACGGETIAAGGASAVQQAEAPTAQSAPAPAPEALRRSGSFGFGKYLAASVAQNQSDTAAAAAYYFAALEADPTNVGLARRAYFYLLAEGQIKPAVALAERVVELAGDNGIAPLVLAAGDSLKRDYDRAYHRLDGAEEQGINGVVVPMMRAWALAGQKKWDEAQAALEPMNKRRELQQLYNFHSAMIADLAGRDEQAWAHYQATLDGTEMLSLRPVQLALNFLARQGRSDDLVALKDRYLRQNPNSLLAKSLFPDTKAKPARLVTSAEEGMAEALYGTASSLLQNSAYDSALVFCRLSEALHPGFPFAGMMVGDILDELERFPEAAATYQKVPSSSPLYLVIRLRLATTLERDKKVDAAAKVLADLVKAYPQQPEPLMAQGDLLRRQEKWGEAEKLYQKALGLLSSTDNRLWSLHYSIGITQERSKQWDKAEASLKTSLELNPNQPQVLNYLGYSWIDRGINVEQGKALIEKAVEQRPTDGYIIDSLGWAYFLTGDYARAVEELERAIEFTPADPTINDHLGDAYWRVGRTNEARFQWQRALGLEPEPEQEKTLREKLDKGL